MKAYRSLKVFLLLLLITEVITAQNTLPQVIPTTPHANSLFKYIDYPVDYSTGLPQINIPLYEIKSGELSVPISISYHSSGRRVYDETGAIGLGWTLMAGGMISRTVYGDADDNDYSTKFPVPWKSQIDINEQNDIDFLARIDNDNTQLNSWFDTEYDIFSYSVNSISGKFVLKDINNTKTAVFIPKKPYLLQWHTANTQFTINYFDELTLTDDKGIIYKFSAREQSSPVGAATAPTTAWLLTSMTSPDHLHVITFKYQSSLTKQRRRI